MSAVDQISDAEVLMQPAVSGPDLIRTPAALPRSSVAPQTAGPLANAIAALQAGISVQDMRDLMTLQHDWEANEARKAYVDAMAAFKRSPPEIIKDKLVSFTTDRGTTAYYHASIGQAVQKIAEGLAVHGFSHRWNTEQADGHVVVTCTITHRAGHSESTTLRAAPDSSGGKNGIQSIASTVTYLQRYTLLSATGLATIDQEDDDGAGAETTGNALRDKWLTAANEAADKDALTKVWTAGLAEIRPTKDMALYEAFKQAVGERGKQIDRLTEAAAARADDFTKAYESEEAKQ